jgi:hypothetical protein
VNLKIWDGSFRRAPAAPAPKAETARRGELIVAPDLRVQKAISLSELDSDRQALIA